MPDAQNPVSSGPCLESEVLAAYVERSLPPDERAVVDAHLAACGDCYVLLTEVIRTTDEMDSAAKVAETENVLRPAFGRRRAWTIAAGVLAAAAAILLVVRSPNWFAVGERAESDEIIMSLAAAVGPERRVEARLTGGFQYGPLQSTERAGQVQTGNLSLLAAAGEAQKRAESSTTADSLHAYGVALLLLGRYDEAIRNLEESIKIDRTRAPALSDLAAAYLARYRATGRDSDLPRALDTVERALALAPDRLELQFNRALALDALHLTDQAIAAYERYLQRDPAGGWSEEARARLTRLRSQTSVPMKDVPKLLAAFIDSGEAPSVATDIVAIDPRDARETFETDLLPRAAAIIAAGRGKDASFDRLMLVASALSKSSGDDMFRLGLQALLTTKDARRAKQGLDQLADGKRAFAADALATAEAHLKAARELLTAANHPYRSWAGFYHAQVFFYLGRVDDSDALLANLRAAARGRAVPVLEARIAYLQGLIEMRRSRYASAAASQRESAELFGRVHEGSLEAAARSELAEALEFLAEPDQAWNERVWTLRYALVRPAHRLRHVVLAGAARAAVRDGLLFAALRFQEATLQNAVLWRRVPAQVEALLRRAEIADRMGSASRALEALAAAQDLFDAPGDRRALRGWESQMHVLRALSLLSEDPVAALSSTIAARLAADRLQSRLNSALIELLSARAARMSGFPDIARQRLGAAMNLLEAEAASLSPEFERVSASDRVWQVFGEAVDLAAERGVLDEAALEIAERGRSLIGLPRTNPIDSLRKAVADALPLDAALVYFEPLPHRLVVWTITRQSFETRIVPIERDALSALVMRLHGNAIEPVTGDRYRDAARELYRQLFASTLQPNTTIVIVADPLLSSVPFGALVDPLSGRHLVEDHPVLVVPNAGAFLVAAANLRGRTRAPVAALLVGNPSSPSAPALPGAAAEIDDVSQLYPGAVALNGSTATVDRLVRSLSRATMFHFGGHATLNARYPRLSSLLLAGVEGSEGSITAADLSKLDLSHLRLAVLAACETAGGVTEAGSPAFGLAKAFLIAGVPNVIGSLWKIDDRATSQLIIDFHSGYAAGHAAAVAMRDSQLRFLAAAEPSRKHPYFWAGLQVYGGLPATETR